MNGFPRLGQNGELFCSHAVCYSTTKYPGIFPPLIILGCSNVPPDGRRSAEHLPPYRHTVLPSFATAPAGLDSSSGGDCAQRTSRRLEQDPAGLDGKVRARYAAADRRLDGREDAGACTQEAATMSRPLRNRPGRTRTCNPRFWSSHHSFASGCVWFDLASFLEETTGTFCV